MTCEWCDKYSLSARGHPDVRQSAKQGPCSHGACYWVERDGLQIDASTWEISRGDKSFRWALKPGDVTELATCWLPYMACSGKLRVSDISAKISMIRRNPPCKGEEDEPFRQKEPQVQSPWYDKEWSWHIPGTRPRPVGLHCKGSGGGAHELREVGKSEVTLGECDLF